MESPLVVGCSAICVRDQDFQACDETPARLSNQEAALKRLEDLHEHVLGHITTIEATYQIARMAIELGVPGDFVECGVYAGAQSAAMARAIINAFDADGETCQLAHHPGYGDADRRVHLFDSFAGFPPLTEHDSDLLAAGTKAGDSACSLADVQANMKRWGIPDELLVYHPGMFAETIPEWAASLRVRSDSPWHIAVLRLDGDLYESTLVCMDHLYPQVVKGGWVIVDDWNLDGCRKAVHEHVIPAPIYWRKN